MGEKKRRFVQLAVTVAFIAAGAVLFGVMTAGKPQLKKQKSPPPVPMVRTITVETGERPVTITGEGTVKPLREIALVPQVGGEVIELSPAMVNGGEFKEGEILVRIDPADYELAVTLAEAGVKSSESNLRMIEEDAAAAREEWTLLREGDAAEVDAPPPLVAKAPQLAAARARLEADRANLSKAILNLERTRLLAPFEGRVRAESIDQGQYVTPGQPLATLYSTEAAEIIVPLEDESLAWIDVPAFTSDRGPGSRARVRTRFAGREQTWQGRLVRAEGALDARTRMVNVVVLVDEPYARRPPLAVGLFVEVEIEGRTLEEAALIPRSALRQGDMVWVVDEEEKLRFREVEVALARGDEVVVRSGLADGDRVVVSALGACTDGMSLRVLSAEGGEEE